MKLLSSTLNFILTFNSVLSYIEVLFNDQNSKLLEIEDKKTLL